MKSEQSISDELVITPSMDWALSGIFLKYELIIHPDAMQNVYVFVSPCGELKPNLKLDIEKVNALYSYGYLSIDMRKNRFRLSNKGFDHVHDRIQRFTGKPPANT